MKALVFALLACIVLTSVASARRRHHSSRHHEKTTTTTPDSEDILDMIAEDNKAEESNKKIAEADDDENVVGGYDTQTKKPGSNINPCANHHCSTGKECDIDENGKPKCVCVRQCANEVDDRRKVCSNYNDTWTSDCELYRMRCLCLEGDEQCVKHKYKHIHVDYYGVCRSIEKCTEEEMSDFPRRMRDWLFNIMRDMADREELKQPYLEMEREAEKSLQHKWVNAVIWKFCDLDTHPHDRTVSRHELFPIRAPLMAMEHCIAPFLDKCDADDDHQITLAEWGSCLGLEEGEIQDKCPQ